MKLLRYLDTFNKNEIKISEYYLMTSRDKNQVIDDRIALAVNKNTFDPAKNHQKQKSRLRASMRVM